MREEAIDWIMEVAEQDAQKRGEGGIAYTVVAPSGFFKDYERIFRCWRTAACRCLQPAGCGCLSLRCILILMPA